LNFNLLDTDRNYLRMSDGHFVPHQAWQASTNPFVIRMASNLQHGTQLKGFSARALTELLSSTMAIRDEAITLDIKYGDSESMDVEVIGAYKLYLEPSETDTAANLIVALVETGITRPQFIVTVTPDSTFWIHSEQALSSVEDDWANIWKADRGI